ncbi:glycosyltransferase family 4 protein [Caldifermentibacillus hisashii]|uniref:glycosyltransferase family 4 protein n=1 Tax=Caldifermentibacillus hisashii TaxID=996558 RepID=UPI001C11FAD2|nr:glycosyltransferase family 4 protein [Caldifermentibacillus hisashii]MBU5343517.1 glycosyltransferase family 4 protein [Caldifermentibacillus hisashii]
MTQALPGVWYAKKHKIPCYLYVQDLWPENVEIITGIKNKKIIGTIGKMVDYIYKHCTKIFTTSNSFIKSISARGVTLDKLEYLPQYAEDFYIPLEKKEIKEIPNDGKFNITFAGNIGKAQGLDILPIAASIIKKKEFGNKVRFNIIGDGRYKDTLINLIKEKNLEDMFNFIPKQPAEKIPEFLAASDAALLTLTKSSLFEKTIPAKLQSYMACGMPIITSASGETVNIVNSSNSGLCNPPDEPDILAENIITMINFSKEQLAEYGRNARNFYSKNFDKEILLSKIDKYFAI